MNDGATVKLPNDDSKYDTKPGITAVLERINALDEKLERRMNDLQSSNERLGARVGDLQSSGERLEQNIESFRSEALKALRQVERQIGHLSGEITKLYAGQQDMEDRITEVEKKAS